MDSEEEVKESVNLFVQGQVTTGWSVDAIVEFLDSRLDNTKTAKFKGETMLGAVGTVVKQTKEFIAVIDHAWNHPQDRPKLFKHYKVVQLRLFSFFHP